MHSNGLISIFRSPIHPFLLLMIPFGRNSPHWDLRASASAVATFGILHCLF